MSVQAVATTKIYCRPECSARPHPRNVRTFGSATEAAAAGYRACLRCRPDAEAIRYGAVDSPLGDLLVAATERGVRAVAIGQRPQAFARGLRRSHPHAWVHHDPDAVAPIARSVSAMLDGDDTEPPALDVPGTRFQRSVWDALRAIPRGQTRSYAELAAAIGRPGAARAVGRACALNRAAIVVPCHRAVGSRGELTGFRWGVERKRELLGRERVPAL